MSVPSIPGGGPGFSPPLNNAPPPPPEQNSGETLSTAEREAINATLNELLQPLLPSPDLSLLRWTGQMNSNLQTMLGELFAQSLESNKKLLLMLSALASAAQQQIEKAYATFNNHMILFNDMRNDAQGGNEQLDALDDLEEAYNDALSGNVFPPVTPYPTYVNAINSAIQAMKNAVQSQNSAAYAQARDAYFLARRDLLDTRTALVQAAEDFNAGIDAYNAYATDFNTKKLQINTEREEYQADPLQGEPGFLGQFTPELPDMELIPETEKIDIDALFPIPPDVLAQGEPDAPPSIPYDMPAINTFTFPDFLPFPIPLNVDFPSDSIIPDDQLTIHDYFKQVDALVQNSQFASLLSQLKGDLGLSGALTLLLAFLQRGAIKSAGVFEPTGVGLGGNVTSPHGVGLTGFILGLSSARLQGVLGNLIQAEDSIAIFERLNGLGQLGQVRNLVNIGVAIGILSSIKNAEFVVKVITEQTSPNSFPAELATSLGIAKGLQELINNGTLGQDFASLFGPDSGLNTLPSDQQDFFLATVGNIASFAVLLTTYEDLKNAIGSPEANAASLLHQALNGTLTQGLESGEKGTDYLNTFKDVLAAAGLGGVIPEARLAELAVAFYGGQNTAVAIQEALAGTGASPDLIAGLTLAGTLAPLAERLGIGGDFLQVEAGSEKALAVANALQTAGFGEDTLRRFLDVASEGGGFAAKVAMLVSAIGKDATSIVVQTLSDKETKDYLVSALGEEMSHADAKTLAVDAMTTLNSIDNQLNQIVNELYKSGHNSLAKKMDEFRSEFTHSQQSTQNLENYSKLYIAAIGSIWGEGTLRSSINMRTDVGGDNKMTVAA